MRATLCHVELTVSAPIEPPQAQPGTWLLQSITPFRERRIILFLGAPKHENLGRLVSGIEPRPDGTFLIELGAILSDHLPSMHGHAEYVLPLPATATHAARELYFSNQLARVRWLRDSDPLQVICPLYRLHEVNSGHLAAPANAHVEYLKAGVTARYEIAGSDPEDALSREIEDMLADFISCINHAVGAHLLVAREAWGILTPTYDHGTFEHMYLLISGADPKRVVAERIAVSAFRAGLGSPEYTEEDERTFRTLVARAGEVDDAVLFLRSAKSHVEGGVPHLALLQLAIAAELAITRYVRNEYLRQHITKKLPSFDAMLNRGLIALAPADNPPDRQLVHRIDALRKLRNKLMHTGTFESSVNDLRQMHNAVKDFLNYLASIERSA